MKNRKIVAIFLILTIIFTLSGGILAYLNWRSASNTAVTFTVEAGFSCVADGGGNIISSQVMLAPSSYTNSTYAIKRTVKVMPTVKSGKMYMYLWLNINKLDTGLKNSDNFKYVLSTSSTSCTTGVVASGNFKGKTAGSTVMLLEEKEYTQTATETYYLYVWLDSAEESTESMNQTFNLSLGGECSNHISTGAEMLMEKANSESLLYADATDEQKKEMWTFSHEATEQVGAMTDYRYIGSSPNNYITFNDEVWRIIGGFDGRIKIMKQDSLGNMSRDYNHSGASFYTFERGTTVYTNRPTNWSGYVGLAYPSDYIYTFANGVDETCFNNGYSCKSSSGAVPTSSWMKVMYGSNTQWLISSNSVYADGGFNVYHAGYVSSSHSNVGDSFGVRPTVYLSSGIKLEGEGTSRNSYQIQ